MSAAPVFKALVPKHTGLKAYYLGLAMAVAKT